MLISRISASIHLCSLFFCGLAVRVIMDQIKRMSQCFDSLHWLSQKQLNQLTLVRPVVWSFVSYGHGVFLWLQNLLLFSVQLHLDAIFFFILRHGINGVDLLATFVKIIVKEINEISLLVD